MDYLFRDKTSSKPDCVRRERISSTLRVKERMSLAVGQDTPEASTIKIGDFNGDCVKNPHVQSSAPIAGCPTDSPPSLRQSGFCRILVGDRGNRKFHE